jgi:hypothetical protein
VTEVTAAALLLALLVDTCVSMLPERIVPGLEMQSLGRLPSRRTLDLDDLPVPAPPPAEHNDKPPSDRLMAWLLCAWFNGFWICCHAAAKIRPADKFESDAAAASATAADASTTATSVTGALAMEAREQAALSSLLGGVLLIIGLLFGATFLFLGPALLWWTHDREVDREELWGEEEEEEEEEEVSAGGALLRSLKLEAGGALRVLAPGGGPQRWYDAKCEALEPDEAAGGRGVKVSYPALAFPRGRPAWYQSLPSEWISLRPAADGAGGGGEAAKHPRLRGADPPPPLLADGTWHGALLTGRRVQLLEVRSRTAVPPLELSPSGRLLVAMGLAFSLLAVWPCVAAIDRGPFADPLSQLGSFIAAAVGCVGLFAHALNFGACAAIIYRDNLRDGFCTEAGNAGAGLCHATCSGEYKGPPHHLHGARAGRAAPAPRAAAMQRGGGGGGGGGGGSGGGGSGGGAGYGGPVAQEATASGAGSHGFAVGDRVVVLGLKEAGSLNGTLGTVRKIMVGRVAVSCDLDQKQRGIRPENIKPVNLVLGNGVAMTASNHAEGAYRNGWQCDQCTQHKRGYRWHNLEESADVCFDCAAAYGFYGTRTINK